MAGREPRLDKPATLTGGPGERKVTLLKVWGNTVRSPYPASAGEGDLFLAHNARKIMVLDLDNERMTVNGDNILAFEEGVDWDIVPLAGAGRLAGGAFNVVLEGTGKVAVTAQGDPVLLDTGTPTSADPDDSVERGGAHPRQERRLLQDHPRAGLRGDVPDPLRGAWVGPDTALRGPHGAPAHPLPAGRFPLGPPNPSSRQRPKSDPSGRNVGF